jgi:hypothetical protein
VGKTEKTYFSENKLKINNKMITSSNQGFIFNYKFAPFSITATLFDWYAISWTLTTGAGNILFACAILC